MRVCEKWSEVTQVKSGSWESKSYSLPWKGDRTRRCSLMPLIRRITRLSLKSLDICVLDIPMSMTYSDITVLVVYNEMVTCRCSSWWEGLDRIVYLGSQGLTSSAFDYAPATTTSCPSSSSYHKDPNLVLCFEWSLRSRSDWAYPRFAHWRTYLPSVL